MLIPTPDECPLLVIDTQVVMDWLVFKDPSTQALAAALESGQAQWIGAPSMLAELRHVLGRGVAASYAPDPELIEATFARLCRTVDQAPPPAVRLICRDPDDQVFIDLALAASARWLISRDRAVLALAKRARKQGLDILTPLTWNKQRAGSSPIGIAPPR
ncbi:putative toxin-antitoxin system toxin component, PIN family [Paucibacter sp. PLA-PC-4]|uniref:putative toxin-antitoxin system toxin component, PIN family n=1 Tax=Paucibacter sp. PLA-PC-4 TaxID=2993655 RepID=UPI00224880F2|nr:putative toxin-antitoxin system toxin component, PIN family [Paucibacter sp. PLA-PC-4]MCX2860614.1 putative toxin-antitoxin system toxin component, PIN family [Paucibacter sp. PLA-PC-4]